MAEEFTFSREWMREQAGRIADPRSPAHQLGRQLNLPPSYLLIHRVTLSTIGVLCQLGATVRMRDEMETWVPGFAPAEPEDADAEAEGWEEPDEAAYEENSALSLRCPVRPGTGTRQRHPAPGVRRGRAGARPRLSGVARSSRTAAGFYAVARRVGLVTA